MGRKKKEIKLKEPVRIREKKLKDGNIALYLDMYQQGERKRESLKLYIIPEKTSTAKLQNENTRKLAEQIKAQRILDIQERGLVNWESTKMRHCSLLHWMKKYADAAETSSLTSQRNRLNAMTRMEEYLKSMGKDDIALEDIDKQFCKDFVIFLKSCTYNQGKKVLGESTVRMFAGVLSATLNMAVSEDAIHRNPYQLLDKSERPKRKQEEREFLTIEELKKIMKTPLRYDIVKKAFLFACFTALRYSDVKSLKWSDIHFTADGKGQYIDKTQVKTRKNVIVPLSAEAIRWLPERVEGKDLVFHELKITQETVRTLLFEWMEAAGIKKHITFHCSRHTCATTLLTLGANLYVVSKLLGHSSIAMTEVYAKIVDQKKIDTVNLVNNMF